MAKQNASESVESVTVTVPVEQVVRALKMNNTNGADDRVIAAPQRDGAEATVRPSFQGSERYSNPSAAPIHVRPQALVEDGFEKPPTRAEVVSALPDMPGYDRRSDEEQERLDEEHEHAVEFWEQDVTSMAAGETHVGEFKGVDLTIKGVDE